MTLLAAEIDHFVNRLTSQHDGLLGECESHENLSSTQEHILMLLGETPELTNSELASTLHITPAATTKALKKLQTGGLLASTRNVTDARRVEFTLTEKARPIALEHASHHQKTLGAYQELLVHFTENEQKTIQKFLSALTEVRQ
ncbi:MAG: MarR family transcriptional regulator [Streptococcaceae bacterium]|jgi:DNA-binding MarR family transcriptional regulator|nr:MarR family transcriptional regulator [Streptococcaceae bacterium]